MRTALAGIVLLCIIASPGPEVLAAEHPHLLFQKADIPALREKVATDPVAAEAMAKIRRFVDQRIEAAAGQSPITLPPENADIRKAWASAVNRNGRLARDGAFCYLMTGEHRYLDVARDFLLTWAGAFDERVNFHRLEDKSYMRIYFTGALGVCAAWTYDMIYDELTPAEREQVEKNLLRKIVQMVKDSGTVTASDGNAMDVDDYEWNGGAWNGVVYGNTGVAAIGFALADPEISEHAVRNWKTYIARDQLADGLYTEEDSVYASFCMGSLIALAEMAYQSGYGEDLWTIRVPSKPYAQWDPNYGAPFAHEGVDPGYRGLRRYFNALLDYQYPDLSPGNWGWRKGRTSFLSSSAYATFLELAYRHYGDPGYAWALSKMDRTRGAWIAWGKISPILYHQALPEDPQAPDTHSRWYNHSKWLALKSVEGKGYWDSDAMYAFMPYGPYRTKALQRLSVDLFAFGKTVAPRVNKMSRHQSHDEAYYLYDSVWNNVQVDGENISIRRTKITDSRMRFQEFTPEIRIAQPVLTVERRIRDSIWSDEVTERREDLDYLTSRTLAMTDTYLFDLAHVRFLKQPKWRHSFSWNWHGAGELTFEGTRHDKQTRTPWSAVFSDDDGVGLKSTLLASGQDCGTMPLWCASPDGQYVRAMRSDYSTAFVAVHEPFRGAPRITAIKELFQDKARVAVKIEAGDQFTDYLCLSYDADGPFTATADGETIAIDGPYGYLRVAGDTITGRGAVTSFSIAATGVKNVVINGKNVEFTTAGDNTLYGE